MSAACKIERITSTVSDIPSQNPNGDSVSSGGQQSPNDTTSTSTENPPLSEQVQNHLTGCKYCQQSLTMGPAGLGQSNQLCSEYWAIIRAWSAREGEVNNIVAHDEYGNQAPTRLDETRDGERWRLA
jgi:hypothetical protein